MEERDGGVWKVEEGGSAAACGIDSSNRLCRRRASEGGCAAPRQVAARPPLFLLFLFLPQRESARGVVLPTPCVAHSGRARDREHARARARRNTPAAAPSSLLARSSRCTTTGRLARVVRGVVVAPLVRHVRLGDDVRLRHDHGRELEHADVRLLARDGLGGRALLRRAHHVRAASRARTRHARTRATDATRARAATPSLQSAWHVCHGRVMRRRAGRPPRSSRAAA